MSKRVVGLVWGAALVAGVCAAPAALAQRPPGADTMSQQAVAESLAVMRDLFDQLRHRQKDAALWYRQGLIAWALYDRDRKSHVEGVDWTLIGRAADSCLRIAKELEPNNPRYVLTAGQYFLGTGLVTMRLQSYAMFGTSLAIARANNDSLLHAEAAIEVGRAYWRRYDAVANGSAESADPTDVRVLAEALSRDSAAKKGKPTYGNATATRPYSRTNVARARAALDRGAKPQSGFAGEADYLKAEEYLREGYDAMPSHPRAFAQLSMLLAERSRWPELAQLAQDHLRVNARDPWSWLVRGLATYRDGDTKTALAAFDRGLALLYPGDRARLDHLERVLLPRDTLATAAMTADERVAYERRYWLGADPLWSRDDIDPRAEFLARVTYAELRWTVEELAKRGADSDRGIVYIRYGPPDRIAAETNAQTWSYDYASLTFKFTAAPTYGTGSFAEYGRAAVVIDSTPALWDNVSWMRIDTIPSQTARFRAAGDSMDVVFATRPPVDGIRRAADLAGPVRTDAWLVGTDGRIVRRDSAPSVSANVATTTHRLGVGSYTLRIEATAEGSIVAGRATRVVDDGLGGANAFVAHGFAMSDLLLATTVTASNPALRRWSDLAVTPQAGTVKPGGDVTLVWENYEFGAKDGAAQYTVAVTIRRERSRAGRIAATIIGNLAGRVGRDASLDQVQLTVDRSQPAAAAFADFVTMSLGTTPPGSYFLTLDVTDRVTGKTASRTVRIVIGDE